MSSQKTYKANQSAVWDFYNPYGGGEPCPKRWEQQYLKGVRSVPSKAMVNGLVFEHELLGATAKNEEVPHLPLLKNGNISKPEKDIRDLANWAGSEVLPHYGIEIIEAQVPLFSKDKKGTADALVFWEGDFAWLDVKFTEVKNDEWNIWDFEGSITSKQESNYEKAVLQAAHYTIMGYEMFGVYLPFIFLVFGKSGWVKPIRMRLTEDRRISHLSKLKQFRKDKAIWETEGYPVAPSLKTCDKCPVENCPARVVFPLIQDIEI